MKYSKYCKDNPHGYWFKRKLYGWGWVPVKWQGWAVTLILIIFITFIAETFLVKGKLIEYFVSLILAVAILIYIAYKKGEKPKWSWGE
jgi:hypothetical protein